MTCPVAPVSTVFGLVLLRTFTASRPRSAHTKVFCFNTLIAGAGQNVVFEFEYSLPLYLAASFSP